MDVLFTDEKTWLRFYWEIIAYHFRRLGDHGECNLRGAFFEKMGMIGRFVFAFGFMEELLNCLFA